MIFLRHKSGYRNDGYRSVLWRRALRRVGDPIVNSDKLLWSRHLVTQRQPPVRLRHGDDFLSPPGGQPLARQNDVPPPPWHAVGKAPTVRGKHRRDARAPRRHATHQPGLGGVKVYKVGLEAFNAAQGFLDCSSVFG